MTHDKTNSEQEGEQYYKDTCSYPNKVVQASFLNGVIRQERESHCGFHYRSWGKDQSTTSI